MFGRKSQPNAKLIQAAAVTRSSVRRYSREFWAALREGTPAGDEWTAALDHAAHTGPLVASWLGHATTLMRLGDKWILTDPVFSGRIGVRIGARTFGVPRLLPAVDPALLPPLDLILISHAHFDHLDRPSLACLASQHTQVITATNTSRLIPGGFGSVTELPWDESLQVGPLTIRAMRPNHWGARTAWDRHRGFNSYVLETKDRRVLYAGDTAFTENFADVCGKQGVDLTLFGIGAYNPWIRAHANPEQVWEMHNAAGGNFLLPIHHSTFKLSDEPLDEPMQRLEAAAAHDRARIVAPGLGALWTP